MVFVADTSLVGQASSLSIFKSPLPRDMGYLNVVFNLFPRSSLGTDGIEALLQAVVVSKVVRTKQSFGGLRSQGGPWERGILNYIKKAGGKKPPTI